jgi:3(or 17)beta-hydroxysteroid dehydrogenase
MDIVCMTQPVSQRLAGKVCIVTGAAMGLGQADAIVLAREGAIVILTDVDAEQGAATAAEIGERALFVHHDVRDEQAWIDLVALVLARFGRLDVLVNNAGVLKRAHIEEATLEDWRFVQSINVEGTFLGIKHSIPAMRASGGGSIINVSSTAAQQGFPNGPAYTASKGAVLALTRSVAIHCLNRGDRIRCNAILPHVAESPMVHASLEESFAGIPVEQRPKVAMGSPFAVANAVLFLASDESSDLNGTTLNLDRGTACIVGQMPEF